MGLITKPMLAYKFDGDEYKTYPIPYPVWATPKLDGIRCIKTDNKALSRTFKPIPNRYVRRSVESLLYNDLDMELKSGDFNDTTSAIMAEEGEPDFRSYILDYVKTDLNTPYDERMEDLRNLTLPDWCIKLIPTEINNFDELTECYDDALEEGHEGVMLRLPKSRYKLGRGTLSAFDLIGLKPFEDAEAEIIGYVEQVYNDNPKEKDAFGNSKRSSCKAGKTRGKGALGKWLVRGVNGKFKGVEFGLGTAKGVTQEMREKWWTNRVQLVGQIVCYKYQSYGSVDAPRIPVFKGFRDKRDM